MERNAIATVLVAALVLLAGCAGGMSGTPTGSADSTTASQATAGTGDGSTGSVNFYISDEQNAISDFEHLNVTITKVGLQPAGDAAEAERDGDDDADADGVDDGNETADELEAADEDTETNETDISTEPAETEGTDAAEADNGDADAAEAHNDDAAEADSDDEAEDGAEGEWVEHEVENRTIDLTRLQGANATQLSTFDAPKGDYEKVYVYVSDVNGTLKDGSDQNVKLPSGKLQLNSEFTVGNGESVDFVFDITAVEAGQSGKYILKPIVSESGTDVEIERVDEDDDADDESDDEDDARENGAENRERAEADGSTLNATFLDEVAPGENATLSVTQNGSAVENATIEIDDESLGTTDADGEFVVSVPDDADELELTVTDGDDETELEFEFEFEDEERGSANGQAQSGGGQSDDSTATA